MNIHSKLNNRFNITPYLIIFLVGIICYHNSFTGEFLFDDWDLVKHLTQWHSLSDVWMSNYLRVVPNLTFFITYKVFGAKEIYFHIINFIIHIVNSFTVYFFTRELVRLYKSEKNFPQKYIPFLTSLIFVSHPIETSAVSYISQRYASLATTFFLLSLLFFVKSKIKKSKTGYLILSLAFTILALLTKENTYILPFVIGFTYLLFFKKKKFYLKEILTYIFPYFFITVATFVLIFNIHLNPNRFIPPTPNPTVSVSRLTYAITEINVIRTYLRLLLLPYNQNVDYDYPIYSKFNNLPTILSIVLILGTLLFAFYFRRKNKLVTYGLGFFFLTVLIESSIFPLQDVIFEHRLYLPSVGFFMAVISIYADLLNNFSNKRLIILFMIFSISLLSYLTILRNRVWESEVALWSDTVTKSPKKARVHYNLGVSYSYINEMKFAQKEFETTIALNPNYTAAYLNLESIYKKNK